MAFLIQGFFFQDNISLGVAHKAAEGAVAVVRGRVYQFMYAGSIWQDPEGELGTFVGRMHDQFGDSILTDIIVNDVSVSFNKAYENRSQDDPIRYTFLLRSGTVWVGRYTSRCVGTGAAVCVITEFEDVFFYPEHIMELLGDTKAHHGWRDLKISHHCSR